MPTPPEPPPVEEILAGANACAEWLVAGGYTTISESSSANPEAVLEHLDHSRVIGELCNERSPCIVLEILVWLWCYVLPQLDRRYNASHRDPGLFSGAIEHNCVRKIRDILASISALRKSIEEVAERQSRRRNFASEPTGDHIKSAFEEWIGAGQRLRALIEPTGVDGILAMQVPHTLADWLNSRLKLELCLYSAQFTGPEICQLLPGGGDSRDLYRRRSRVLQQSSLKGFTDPGEPRGSANQRESSIAIRGVPPDGHFAALGEDP